MCLNLSSYLPSGGRAAALPTWLAAISVASLMLVLGGCPDRTISPVVIDPDSIERVEIPSTVKNDLDLLFVIDNSVSMNEEQESLKANFRRFTDVLSTIEGGMPNLHIGVVTSDMGSMGGAPFGVPGGIGSCADFGDNGDLQTRASVTAARFLENLRDPATGVRSDNYEGELQDAFGQIAVVGASGCNYESHLMSMKRALLGNAGNAGFLRQGAYLAVIFIADEDDCSIREDRASFFSQTDLRSLHSSLTCFRSSTLCDGPRESTVPGPRPNCRPNEESPYHASVKEMVDFLKELKGEDSLIVAGIVGDPRPVSIGRSADGTLSVTPTCSYGGSQVARPAVRLESFIRSFRHHTVTTICDEDLSDALEQVGKLVVQAFPRCFDSPLAEPHTCSVVDVVNPNGPGRVGTPLPECDLAHSQKPCWHLAEDPVACAGSETKLTLRVDRGGAPPPVNSKVIAECVTL